MNQVEEKMAFQVGAVAVVAVGAFLILKSAKNAIGTPAQAAQAVAGAVVDVVSGAASGTVVSIGQAVGIPATSLTECERAKAEGRTWDASFACPATDFLSYVFTGKTTINAGQIDGVTPADGTAGRSATSGGRGWY